ncbi:hypothetical protein [Streptomyces sp. IMTB 2501]|uniref:hypothetical protein n=1 Tax=Streptomyces sp. IMTB 2501 TaxID=1776340 RepID=UPI00117FF0EE|nr:hypothetical protein [Streptomyces sp. IMTB 2501]
MLCVFGHVVADADVVNQVIPDDALLDETTAFAREAAKGPTHAYGAYKGLLRVWSVGGVSAADEAMSDIAMSLFRNRGCRGWPGLRSQGIQGEPSPPRTRWRASVAQRRELGDKLVAAVAEVEDFWNISRTGMPGGSISPLIRRKKPNAFGRRSQGRMTTREARSAPRCWA